MFKPATPQTDDSAATPARLNFLQRLESLAIRPAAREYYVRGAEAWIKAHGHRSADTTSSYFDALGRSTHLADWQFRQAVHAARILACDILNLPWAAAFDWQGLSDQAKSLEPSHRTHGREAIRTVQDLLGHASVKTTMIYLHVMKRPGAGAPSPLDLAL